MQSSSESSTSAGGASANNGASLPTAVLLAAAAVLALCASVLALSLRDERRQIIDSAYASAERGALKLAVHAGEVIDRADTAALLIASVRENGNPFELQELRARGIVLADVASAFVVTDREGRVLDATTPDVVLNLGADAHFQRLARTPQAGATLGTPMADPIRGGSVIPLMRRIEGAGGFDGAVVALLSPEALVRGFGEEADDDAAYTIVGMDEQVRARRRHGRLTVEGRVPDAANLVANIRQLREQSLFAVSPIDGRRIVTASAPIAGRELAANVSLPAAGAEAAYAQARNRALSWAGAAGLVLGIGTLLLWRQARQLESGRRVARRASALYEATLEGSLDALWLMEPIADETGTVVDFLVGEANRRSLQMIGRPRDKVIGRRISELLPPTHDDGLRFLLQRAHLEQRPLALEAQRSAEPLLGHWLHLQAVPAHGNVALIVRDITERREAEARLARREAFLRTLLDALPLAVYAKGARAENHGEVMFWNRAAETQYGRAADEVIGRPTHSYLPDSTATEAILQDTEVARERRVMDFPDLPWPTDRGLRYLNFLKAPVTGPDGEVDMVLVIAEDVTEHRAAAESLRLMSRVVQETGDAIVVADAQGYVKLVNASFAAMSGRAPETLVNTHMRELGFPKPSDDHLPGVVKALDTQRRWSGEYRLPRLNGEPLEVWMQICAITDEAGRITHRAGIFSDISVQKKQERALADLARRDVLTQLANRRHFEEQLEAAAARAQRQGQPMALIYLDLDGFKQVNDNFGHEAGDRLLIEVAQRLRQNVRATDLASRLGGDEFTVILEHAGDAADRAQQCQRLLEALSQPHDIDGRHVVSTPSIGMAVYRPGESTESLRQRADAAMYAAKRSGKGRVRFAEDAAGA